MRRVLLGLIVVLFWVSAPVAGAAPLGIEVRETKESDPFEGTLDATVPDGATDAVFDVYVSHAGTEALAGVDLSATAGGSQTSVTIGGTPATDVTIPAGDGVRRVTVRIAAPPVGKVTPGQLTADTDDNSQTLLSFRVLRPDDTDVAILGADNTGLNRTTESDATTLRFEIASSTQRDVDDLRIGVTPLKRGGQQPVPTAASLDGQPLQPDSPQTLPGFGKRVLVLEATTLEAGDYTGSITLRYGTTSTSTAVKVTRSIVPLSVAVAPLGSSQYDSDAEKRFDLNVRETGNRTVVLAPPTLTLNRKDGAAEYRVSGGKLGFADGAATKTIAPGSVTNLTMRIEGIEKPSEYTMTLRFPGLGTPVEATGTLYVRWPVWGAVIVLSLAVVLSSVVTWLVSRRTKRLRAERAIARVNDELDRQFLLAGSPEEEAEIVMLLRLRLKTAVDKVRDDPDTPVDTERDAVFERLPTLARWLALRRAAREAGLSGKVGEDLSTAENYLRDLGTTKVDANKALDEVRRALEVAAPTREEIDTLATAFEQWRNGPHPAAVDASAIDAKLTEAENSLRNGDPALAAGSYDEAWRLWLGVAAADLSGLLAAEHPTGVSPSDWQALHAELATPIEEIATAGDPETAMATYRHAYLRYIAVAAGGLHAGAVSGLAIDPNTAQAVAQRAEAAVEAATRGQLEAAWSSYEDARDISASSSAVPLSAAQADGGQMPPPMAGSPVAAPGRTIADPPAILLANAGELSRKLRATELLVAIIAGILLTVSGAYVVYTQDPAWGGFGDGVQLFLWGVGLGTIGGAGGFLTVQGAIDRISGTGRPAA